MPLAAAAAAALASGVRRSTVPASTSTITSACRASRLATMAFVLRGYGIETTPRRWRVSAQSRSQVKNQRKFLGRRDARRDAVAAVARAVEGSLGSIPVDGGHRGERLHGPRRVVEQREPAGAPPERVYVEPRVDVLKRPGEAQRHQPGLERGERQTALARLRGRGAVDDDLRRERRGQRCVGDRLRAELLHDRAARARGGEVVVARPVWKKNQCVGCTRQFFTKSFLGDDAAVLAQSSGGEPAAPRSRADVASMERAVKF